MRHVTEHRRTLLEHLCRATVPWMKIESQERKAIIVGSNTTRIKTLLSKLGRGPHPRQMIGDPH